MGCEEAPARDDASSEKMNKKKDVFGMDVKALVHIFPLHSTATVYCNTLELVVAGVT
jgi:hypothetical protein